MTQPESDGGDYDYQRQAAIDLAAHGLLLTLPQISETSLLIDLLTEPPSPATATTEVEASATGEDPMDTPATEEATPVKATPPIDMLS